MIEQSFFSALSSIQSIKSICGSRIYPLVLPQAVQLPAIDYSFIGGSTAPTNDTRGPREYRIEVNAWGSTYGDAVTLRHAVITALDGYLDANMSIRLIQPRDLFDPDLRQYRAMAEFYIISNL